MFRRLHFKLTAYMGLILIVFMFFVATGIYSFTRIVYEDGNKDLMETEAIRIYTYRSMTYSGFMLNGSFLQRFGPSVALMGTQKLDACYVIYDKNLRRVYSEENEIAIADDIKSLAEKSLQDKQDSFVTKKIGRFNYRIYTKLFND